MAGLTYENCFAQHFETALSFNAELSKERDYALSLSCKVQPAINSQVAILTVVMEIEARLPPEAKTPVTVARGKFHAIFLRDDADDVALDTQLRQTAFPIAIREIRKMLVQATSILNLPELFDFPDIDMEKVEWKESISCD